jgi:protein-S-isoprenylcysteine O-methyltransferase Ste14
MMNEVLSRNFTQTSDFAVLMCLAATLPLETLYPTSIPYLSQGIEIGIGALLLITAWTAIVMVKLNQRECRKEAGLPEPTIGSMTTGPFSYTRNPTYLSMLAVVAGLGLILDSVWLIGLAIPAAIYMHWFLIKPEEVYLEKKFGQEYLEYKKKTRCWV